MASPTRLSWVSVDSGGWWWTGKPGMLHSMWSQRVGHNWATELNWTRVCLTFLLVCGPHEILVEYLRYSTRSLYHSQWKLVCMPAPYELWELFGLQLSDSLSLSSLTEFYLEYIQVSIILRFSPRILGVLG